MSCLVVHACEMLYVMHQFICVCDNIPVTLEFDQLVCMVSVTDNALLCFVIIWCET